MTANKMVATHVLDTQPRKDSFTGLRSPDLLAKWPVVGLIMSIFGILTFAGLALNLVDQGPLLGIDRALATALPAIALKGTAIVKDIMDAGFYIGKEVIMVLSILLFFYFLFKHYWQELAMVTFGLVGSSTLFLSLTSLFARARPPTQIWIQVNLPGFPSGHAISVVAFYGLLAYLLVPKIHSAFWKGVVVAAAVFIIVFVGFTRVFTGGHYLTDVLAGYALGIAWSGTIYTLIELYFQKRRSQNVKKE